MWIYGEEVTFQGPSWLAGWKYRKSHEIIGSPAGAQSNYQIRFKAIYGFFYPELVLTAPHSGYNEGVTYAVVDGYLYWGVNYGGGTEGYIYKTDLATLETATLYTGNYKAEWQGVKVGDYIYAVGEEKDSGGTFRSSIHIINTLNDNVTAVRHPNTGDCNELIGVDTDGEIIVAGERVGGGDTTGSSWPNGGGVWKIPIESITDPSTWERTWEDPNHYGWVSIAYFNGKWYAMLVNVLSSTGAWRVISSSDLYTWNTELDYTGQNVGQDSRGCLVKCGNRLVALAPVASTNTYHMFVFDGTSWTDYDLEIPIIAATSMIKGVWSSEKSRLIILVSDWSAKRHNVYSVKIDGTELRSVATNLPKGIGHVQSDQGVYCNYNDDKFYGVVAGSGGTGSVYRVHTHSHGEVCILNEKCRDDFGDIRFTDSDALTELPYWMEEKVDGIYAIFWVKIPSIPASPDVATIYIYYGNPSATTSSNIKSASLWNQGDDFNDNSRDVEIWDTVIYGTGNVNETNQRLEINVPADTDYAGYVSKDYHSGHNFQVEILAHNTEIQSLELYIHTTKVTNDNPWLYDDCYRVLLLNELGEFRAQKRVSGEITTLYSGSLLANEEKIKIRVKDDTVELYEGDVLRASDTYALGSRNIYIIVGGRGHSPYVGTDWLDNVWIRKYVDPEPSHGDWGAEESI